MRTNQSWKDYFVFSKRERKIFIGLLTAFILYCLILLFYNPSNEQPTIENLDETLASLSSQKKVDKDSNTSGDLLADVAETDNDKTTATLFLFDPNTLDEAGFQRLGLRDKTIRTLINYRSKGGQFRKPEDLRKIYGLRQAEADKLMPYVRINPLQKAAEYNHQNIAKESKTEQAYHKPAPKIIDINTASVDDWKSLPAIGDVLSNRIVKYRDKMGSFTSVEQVKKTYGLSDSAYEAILPYLSFSSAKVSSLNTSSLAKKININTASAEDLKSNPNISSDIAEAIVVYRKQHGNYSSVEDIKKIVFITDELYQKVAAYLTVK